MSRSRENRRFELSASCSRIESNGQAVISVSQLNNRECIEAWNHLRRIYSDQQFAPRVGARAFDPKSHRVHFSVVTRAELFAGNPASDAITVVLAPFREIEIDRAIAERAGRIRRETGIRLPDALIAATAVERKLSLFTRNRSDFEKVRRLRVREI